MKSNKSRTLICLRHIKAKWARQVSFVISVEMKLIHVLVLTAACATAAFAQNTTSASSSGFDFPQTLLNQFTRISQQINAVAGVLGEMSRSITGMIASGTRLVSGLQTVPSNVDQGLVGGIAQSINSITGQLATVQRTLTDITGQLTHIVQTTTRAIGGTGPLAADEPSFGEAILGSTADWTRTVDALANVLSDLNNQWNRILEQGSRLVSGQSSDGSSIAGTALQALSQVSSQIQSLQRVLGQFSTQLNRMIASSTRLVSGQDSEDVLTTDAAKELVDLTSRLLQLQRVLGELTIELNRIIDNGGRVVLGQSSEHNGQNSLADNTLQLLAQLTSQLQAVQRVLAQLSAQLNRMVTTGTRLVSGQDSEGPARVALVTLGQLTEQVKTRD